MDADPLLAHFMKYFEILRADTPALREEGFRLRYQVYCVEGAASGFERGGYPDGLERDTYDARSVHCLLLHRPTLGALSKPPGRRPTRSWKRCPIRLRH